MSRYAQHVSTRQTSQSEKIQGKDQVENSAGGYVFSVDCWVRLRRFLILGNEGGLYYANEKTMTKENVSALDECITSDPKATVEIIRQISVEGRAPKNDPAVFALAYCAGKGGEVADHALSVLNDVCRIGTHLFQFCDAVENFRGWGRSLRRAVANWYLSKSPREVVYQATKYQQRDGWSHRDVLRLSHPYSAELQPVFEYIAQPERFQKNAHVMDGEAMELIDSVEKAKHGSEETVVSLIREKGLVRECVPSEYLNSPRIWEALLERMPLTAMIRNLGKMASVGLLTPMSSHCKTVADRLTDTDKLRKARIHPLQVLIASSIYSQGRGFRGSLSWNPDGTIVEVLDDAFYQSFHNVEPTGKRHLLAIDISGSMTWSRVAGSHLTPRDASAAMAMVSVRSELLTHTTVFSSRKRIAPASLTKKTSLNEAVKEINGRRAGGTDCALPMLYALENGIEVDVFVVYTDNETWAGDIHPCQALQRYREKMGIDAKLIVVGMVSNGFSIADPDDAGMMDVVGFDSSVPQVMSDFARQ